MPKTSSVQLEFYLSCPTVRHISICLNIYLKAGPRFCFVLDFYDPKSMGALSFLDLSVHSSVLLHSDVVGPIAFIF